MSYILLALPVAILAGFLPGIRQWWWERKLRRMQGQMIDAMLDAVLRASAAGALHLYPRFHRIFEVAKERGRGDEIARESDRDASAGVPLEAFIARWEKELDLPPLEG